MMKTKKLTVKKSRNLEKKVRRNKSPLKKKRTRITTVQIRRKPPSEVHRKALLLKEKETTKKEKSMMSTMKMTIRHRLHHFNKDCKWRTN
jgi:hypothetical protein